MSSKGTKSETPTNFKFDADDLNVHFLSIPDKTVQNLPISPVSPLSYISETDVPCLDLTAVTEDLVIFVNLILRKQLVVISYLLGSLRLVLRPWVGCSLCL